MPVIPNFPYSIGDSVASFISHTIVRCIDKDEEIPNIDNYVFYYCSYLTTISFPVCTSIGASAFGYCTSLSEASFPVCTSIGSSAFYSCTSLKSFYLMGSSVPTLASSVFNYTPMSNSTYLGYYGSIYVPSSLVDDYKTATNWSAYSNRIVGV